MRGGWKNDDIFFDIEGTDIDALDFDDTVTIFVFGELDTDTTGGETIGTNGGIDGVPLK